MMTRTALAFAVAVTVSWVFAACANTEHSGQPGQDAVATPSEPANKPPLEKVADSQGSQGPDNAHPEPDESQQAHGENWHTNLEEAKAEAAKSKRLVLLDFSASWCPPCQEYARDVFPTDEFKKTASDFVFVLIDVDKQRALSDRYNITAVPTFLIMTPGGKIVHQFQGYLGLDGLLDQLRLAKEKAG